MELLIKHELLNYLIKYFSNYDYEFALGLGRYGHIIELVIVLSNNLNLNSRIIYEISNIRRLINMRLNAFIHYHELTLEPSLIDIEFMKLWRIPWVLINKLGMKFLHLEIDDGYAPQKDDLDKLFKFALPLLGILRIWANLYCKGHFSKAANWV